MMHEDEAFDKLIQGKLENRSFDVNHANWVKAEQMIKVSRAGKFAQLGKFAQFGMSFGIVTGVCAVLVGIVVLVNHFSGDTNTTAEKEKVEFVQHPAPEKNSINSSLTDNSDSAFSSATENNQAAKENNSIAPANEKSATGSISAPQEKNSTAKNLPGQNNSAHQVPKSSSSTNNKNKSLPDHSTGQQKNSTTKNGSSASKQKRDSLTLAKTTKTSTDNSKNTADATPVSIDVQQNQNSSSLPNIMSQNQNYSSEVNQPGKTKPGSILTEKNFSIDTTSKNNLGAEQKNQNDKTEQPVSSVVNKEQPVLVTNSDSTIHFASNAAHAPVENTQTQEHFNDSVGAGKSGEVPPFIKPGPGVNFLFAEAGISFIPGKVNSINPVIGLGYSFRIGKMFSMQTGLRYTSIGHVSDSSVLFNSSSYGFGLQQDITEIKIRRLHYFALPVSVSWHLSGRSAFSAGASLNYLFTTSSLQNTYSGTETTPLASKTALGYTKGMNRFDVLLTGSYTHSFSARWDAELSGYFGLTPFKSDYYMISNFHRNNGFQLTLHYNF